MSEKSAEKKATKEELKEEEVEGEEDDEEDEDEEMNPMKGKIDTNVVTLNFKGHRPKIEEYRVRVYVQSGQPTEPQKSAGEKSTPPWKGKAEGNPASISFDKKFVLKVNDCREDYLCFEVISGVESCGWCFIPLKYICHKSTVYVGRLLDSKRSLTNLTFAVSSSGFGYTEEYQKWLKKETDERMNKRKVKKSKKKKKPKKKKMKVKYEVLTAFDITEFRKFIVGRVENNSFCDKCKKFVYLLDPKGVCHTCHEDCTNPLEKPHRGRPLTSFEFVHRCDPTRGQDYSFNHNCHPLDAARGFCSECEGRRLKGETHDGKPINPRLHAVHVGQKTLIFH